MGPPEFGLKAMVAQMTGGMDPPNKQTLRLSMTSTMKLMIWWKFSGMRRPAVVFAPREFLPIQPNSRKVVPKPPAKRELVDDSKRMEFSFSHGSSRRR